MDLLFQPFTCQLLWGEGGRFQSVLGGSGCPPATAFKWALSIPGFFSLKTHSILLHHSILIGQGEVIVCPLRPNSCTAPISHIRLSHYHDSHSYSRFSFGRTNLLIETMDSSFYLLPKNGVPPSITMFSFKNVTLKKIRSISSAVPRISFCSQ